MPKEKRVSNIDYEKRIRQVQEWIIDDWPSCDIVLQCVKKYDVSERHAKRYIAEATERWVDTNQEKLNAKRARRIESLKKLKRSLKEVHAGSPAGISALLRVEKELARLEGAYPTKEMIDAQAAEAAGRPVDPLNPATHKLIIEALPPYAVNQAIHTANTQPSV